MKLTDKAITEALKEGKAIRRTPWEDELGIILLSHTLMDAVRYFNGEQEFRAHRSAELTIYDISADDWEVVE